MKLIDIVNAHNTIDGLSDNGEISVCLAYSMAKFVVATQPDADFFAKEMRMLFDKYGEKTENDDMMIKTENLEAFYKEVEALQNTEADDPGIRFSLSEMSNELKLSMKQIYSLMPFIKDDQEKK